MVSSTQGGITTALFTEFQYFAAVIAIFSVFKLASLKLTS